QNVIPERPDGRGGMAPCDTWDNALLHTTLAGQPHVVPMTIETKRIAPSETNTWYIEVLGMEGGVRYSTKTPKTLWTFSIEGKAQRWQQEDLGFQGPFPTITGGIFEPGFPDCFQQMLAAYFAERAGALGERFGCVRPEEAVDSHRLFAAALTSHHQQAVISLPS
ncbi:MAG: gfo/Idh/MocA family oxidoreductase, partial [Bacteroidetes bacterium]